MSVEQYTSGLHTPEVLASQIGNLPDNFVLAGSIGRCVLMGILKPLKQPDGGATDIDVVDMTGTERQLKVPTAEPFPVDAMLTRTLRPSSNGWGLFMIGYEEPFVELDSELCQPQAVLVPWDQNHTALVLPTGLQAELIDIKGRYHKNKAHVQQFRAFASDHRLPNDVVRAIEDFKRANWEYERTHHNGKPLNNTARLYKQAKRTFKAKCPSSIQRAIETTLGETIRKVRRATIDL